jgi:hypothetical protein
MRKNIYLPAGLAETIERIQSRHPYITLSMLVRVAIKNFDLFEAKFVELCQKEKLNEQATNVKPRSEESVSEPVRQAGR